MPRTRTLTQMHRHATAYEIVAELPTGTIRLGFTIRPSARTFLRMAMDHREAIIPHIREEDDASYTAAGGLRLNEKVTIRKSGKTERDCAIEERRI